MAGPTAAQPLDRRKLRRQLLRSERAQVERHYLALRAFRLTVAACGALVTLLAALALTGRLSGRLLLASLVPGGRIMCLALSVSFLVLGLALLSLGTSRQLPRRLVQAAGLLAAAVALARLAEVAARGAWGVSDLFLSPPLPPAPPGSGYSELGAFAMLAAGAGTALATVPRAERASGILGTAVAVTGVFAMLSYMLGHPLLLHAGYSPVSLPAALALAATGLGLTIAAAGWQEAAARLTDARIDADQLELRRLTEELKRQRNEVEAILGAAAAGIVSFNREGRVARRNTVAARMLAGTGFLEGKLRASPETSREASPEASPEAPSAASPDVLDEQGGPVPLEETAVYRALQGEAVKGMIVQLPKAAGGPVWVSASAVPLVGPEGVYGAVLVMTDISDLRETREQARQYADQLQAVMDYAPAGIILYDREGRIHRLNDEASQALGLTDELLRATVEERFRFHEATDENQQPIAPNAGPVQAVMSGKVVRDVVVQFPKSPRGPAWLSFSGASIRREDGTLDGIVAAFVDVTRLHNAQEQAETLARELDVVLSSIADAVVHYDREGRVVRMNPAALRLFGHHPQTDAMPWPERYRALSPVGGDGEPVLLEAFPLGRALAGEPVVGFTMRYLPADGPPTPWLSASAAPVTDRGEIVGAVMAFSDVSRLREVEDELRSYQDRLEKLVATRTAALQANQQRLRALAGEVVTAEQRERQRLAGAIHDEVAQALGVVKLHLGLLRNQSAEPEAQATIAELIALTDEAIKQSRAIMVELSPPILQKAGLVQALQWWAEQVRERHGLPVQLEVSGEIGRLDPDVEVAVFQAVKELLQNVVKHAAASSASVHLRSADEALAVEVRDDGGGFDAAAVVSGAQGGFGLLSVHERMAYLGGSFQIQSRPGEGTRAEIVLPLTARVAELVDTP